jgi:hypothetical protein
MSRREEEEYKELNSCFGVKDITGHRLDFEIPDLQSSIQSSASYIIYFFNMPSYTQVLALGLTLMSTAISSPITLEQRACTGPNVNAATVALVKEFEGFVASPAPDPIGLPTVGYGHLCKTSGCGEVPYSFPLTEASATQLLADDLKVY